MADAGVSTSSGVHLAEVVAAIGLAGDLGIGQPLDHVLRSCTLATRLADVAGASPAERDATYWVTMFVTAGCTGVSYEMSTVFGDDIAFRAGSSTMGMSKRNQFSFLFRSLGSHQGPLGRFATRVNFARAGFSSFVEVLLAHCAVSAQLADRLDLGDDVVAALLQTFESWDGSGFPDHLEGADIALPIRLANVAFQSEIRFHEHGVTKACADLRSGTELDPGLIDLVERTAEDLTADLDESASWDRVVAAAPRRRGALTHAELDDALELFADYADLKSPWFTGHSRAVASLAVAAGRQMNLPDEELRTLRRAALLHDIGRNGVPNTIWDKPGALSPSEVERVRLHAYYTDRVVHRASRLAPLASLASAAHERHDGSGYPRGIAHPAVPALARLLAAADTYHAMLEDRPHRSAPGPAAAATELRRATRDGELDGPAVDAVLAAAGHVTRRRPSAPDGLTPRELEVLVLAARGLSTKAIASSLAIAPKTAGNHIERIYAKIGVSSRAEAAMYAMQHGLVPNWERGEP